MTFLLVRNKVVLAIALEWGRLRGIVMHAEPAQFIEDRFRIILPEPADEIRYLKRLEILLSYAHWAEDCTQSSWGCTGMSDEHYKASIWPETYAHRLERFHELFPELTHVRFQ